MNVYMVTTLEVCFSGPTFHSVVTLRVALWVSGPICLTEWKTTMCFIKTNFKWKYRCERIINWREQFDIEKFKFTSQLQKWPLVSFSELRFELKFCLSFPICKMGMIIINHSLNHYCVLFTQHHSVGWDYKDEQSSNVSTFVKCIHWSGEADIK